MTRFFTPCESQKRTFGFANPRISYAYPGATNIPLSEVGKRLAEFGDRKRSVVGYCRSGSRSGQARAILERNGFADVTNGGGLAGMPAR
jgi:rhodanese-related sulfurtransferase